MQLTDSDDETGGPEVDDDEFEVFQVLEGVVDACCCRSPGPVWCEPESLDDAEFITSGVEWETPRKVCVVNEF